MTNTKWFVFAFLIGFCTQSTAYVAKDGNVTATVGPYIYRTDYESTHTIKDSRPSGGLGLVVTGDLSKKGALEIAMFQMYKTYFREHLGQQLGVQTAIVHITMGYRWWLSSNVSTSLGLYSAYSMGKPRYIFSEFTPGQEIKTSADDLTEYGFDLAAQTELWSHNEWAVVLDGRYSISVTSKSQEHGNHYGLVLGLRYLIQEKGKKDSK